MKPVYTKSLIKDFPDLHRYAQNGVQSSMHYGFAIGDGWYQIYYEWCAKVVARAVANGIKPGDDRYPVAEQVKEKFGGLRIYYSPYSEYADLTKVAVEKAACTCEVCGQPGKMRAGEWYRVACDRCDARKVEVYAEMDAQFDAQERAGGYRKPIDDAFAEVDAERLDRVCAASKQVRAGEVGKRESVVDAVMEWCRCGINKEVCDRTNDPDLCRRVAVVMEARRRDDEDES